MSLLKNLSTTSGGFFVVVVVFVLSLVSAQNDLEVSPQSDLESMDEIQELLRNVQLIFEAKIASKVREGKTMEDEDEEEDGENDVEVDANGCKCGGLKCSCCQRIRIKVFKIKDKSKNPPRICVGVPFWKKGASVCIQFYNLNVAKKSVSGCSRFRATLLNVTVAKFKLGCFRFNYLKNETQEIDEVELLYLDGPQGPVDEPGPIYFGEGPMEEIQPAEYKTNDATEDFAH